MLFNEYADNISFIIDWIENELELIIEAKYGHKLIEKEHKIRLTADEIDRGLYEQYATQNKMLAAKIVAARYGYLRSDLQDLAIKSGVYFKDVNENIESSPGILVIVKKGIPEEHPLVSTWIKKLRERLTKYQDDEGHTLNIIPYLHRFGGTGKVGLTGSSGVTPERLQKGWIVGYHRKGVAVNKEDIPSDVSKQKSAVDVSEKPAEEKEMIKKLTYSGNKFVDDVLFAPKTVETGLKNIDDTPLTNKDILAMAEKQIYKDLRPNEDPEDMLAAFAMAVRDKYGELVKSEDVPHQIVKLVKIGMQDVRASMQASHGATEKGQAGRTKSVAATHIDTGEEGEEGSSEKVSRKFSDFAHSKRLDIAKSLEKNKNADDESDEEARKGREDARKSFEKEREMRGVPTYKKVHLTPEEEAEQTAQQSFNSYIKARDKAAEELKARQKTAGRTFAGSGTKANVPNDVRDRLRKKFGLG